MDIKKARRNFFVMLFFLAICILLFAYVIPVEIPVPNAAQGQPFTPQTFPYLLASGLLICTVIGLIQYGIEYLQIRRAMAAANLKEEKQPLDKKRILESIFAYLMYGLMVIYGLMFSHFGFIISTLIIPPLFLIILKDRKWYHYLIFYAFAAVMYIVFRVILKVQLP
jgi:hypothetical protein